MSRSAELENRAVALLARRDYGRAELRERLLQRFPDEGEQVETLLDALSERGWLDEQRFVDSAVDQYRARGDGPAKIRHRLAGRLDEAWRLDEALAAVDEDVWVETAREALRKKFGTTERPRDPKEVARRLRFLQGRGFTSAQCWSAFEE
ncbi:regulatory protein RecX [Sulfurivirga sp.]|uniref:regulatory protein RecX n=1 Tax=Sulfurivirga sp. TaxID=2614236 RepID=UPI0025FC9829|nr:regulatory protein RecX [Sulfurivirga sp.]